MLISPHETMTTVEAQAYLNSEAHLIATDFGSAKFVDNKTSAWTFVVLHNGLSKLIPFPDLDPSAWPS